MKRHAPFEGGGWFVLSRIVSSGANDMPCDAIVALPPSAIIQHARAVGQSFGAPAAVDP